MTGPFPGADDARDPSTDGAASFGRVLFHRWFIQYNPLYLVSALLVLIGVTLLSSAGDSTSLDTELGPGAFVAEVYAFALIGGAALLYRLGLRRPAVLLGLLAVIYQGDPTLLSERAVFLGRVGDFASAAWMMLFVPKLCGLAWSLRLRMSRSALAVPALGAFAIGVLPRLVQATGDTHPIAVVAIGTSAVFAAALATDRQVESLDDLDAWGATVLRRGLRATWTIWAALFLGHAAFSCHEYRVSLLALAPALLLVLVHRLAPWSIAVGAVLFVGLAAPQHLWLASLLASGGLMLRAIRTPTIDAAEAPARPGPPPYRAGHVPVDPTDRPRPRSLRFTLAPRAERLRLFTGALFTAYLSAWTIGWSGSWPTHRVTLDLAFTAVVLLLAWRGRVYLALVPAVATYLHFAIERRVLVAPATPLEWGVATVAIGFALLVGSLGVTLWLRPRASGAVHDASPPRDAPA